MAIRWGFSVPSEKEILEGWIPSLMKKGFSWLEIKSPEEIDEVTDPLGKAAVDYIENLLRELSSQYNFDISVHCRFVGLNLSSPNKVVRRATIKALNHDLEFAANIGAKLVVLHLGTIDWSDFPSPDYPYISLLQGELQKVRTDHKQAALESIDELANFAINLGIKLTIENLYRPWELMNSSDEIMAFLKDLNNPNVGVTLDFGHSLLAGEDPQAFIEKLEGLIWHTHLHTNDGKYDLHLPLIKLSREYREALKKLWLMNPNTVFLLELPRSNTEEYLSSLTTLRKWWEEECLRN
ncbi:Sugar phosphate isomerase/epimerase [Thermanaeromonas toyohensis ToBE]|uniref:Sugar phosphate isomerase/epimerase n=1 Tax=Thermanaeromonas toyohensis ToBE TaxID=698762 RepID=A0A1W1VZA4_9FIRM|nr:sugar phosphate isomerase/epimerase [Thermanaeromonas toyohensis]SMB98184.1 Sugar phosphate isomerase/epimerase [Thermanaeromonas toyohensis ToBE]